MLSKSMLCHTFFSLVLLISSNVAWAREVAAKVEGVEVYAKPDKDSSVVKKLHKDEAVEAIERLGMFWQINAKDAKGYVFVTKVQSRGGEEKGAISSALREAVQQGRQEDDSANVRTRSAVMGVRGLDSSDSEFAGNVKPNLRMVYAMENINTNKAAVKALGTDIQKELDKIYAKK